MMRKILVGFWAAITGISQAVVPVAALTLEEIWEKYPFSTAGSCTGGKGAVPKIAGILCILEKTILTLLNFAEGIALLFLVYGGIQYLVSGGDKIALTTAKHTITYSLLGLIVILAAILIIKTAISAL